MRSRQLSHLAAYGAQVVVATGLDTACVLLGRRVVPLLVAVSVGYLANTLAGYVFGRYLVFPGTTRSHAEASWRYGALIALNIAIGVLGVTAVVDAGAHYLVARVMSSSVLVPTNYAAMRWWVFASHAPSNVP